MRNNLIARNEWFPGFFNTGWDRFFEAAAEDTTRALTAPADVEETETHYSVSIDVPGMKKEDIAVEVAGDLLTVRGERKKTATSDKRTVHFAESRYGRFERHFRFGDKADLEKIEAQFSDGVLHLSIPKKEETKPRKIEVKVN